MKKIIILQMLVICFLCIGCNTYYITQADSYRNENFSTGDYKKAAVMGMERYLSGSNPLFFSALNVGLLKKNVEIVEREKILEVIQEQQMIDKKFANLSDIEKAKKLGRVLGVDVVIYASVLNSSIRYKYNVSAAGKVIGYFGMFIPLLIFSGEARDLEDAANKTGQLDKIDSILYTPYSFSDTGLTLRAIDVKTGEIIWIGYRITSTGQEIADNPKAMNEYYFILSLAEKILGDFYK